jgi:hypothetical protein
VARGYGCVDGVQKLFGLSKTEKCVREEILRSLGS